MAVRTVSPRQAMSRGRPTFTESSRGIQLPSLSCPNSKLWMLCQKLLDPCQLAITQAEIRCRDQFFNLAGAACTNNGSRDGWIMQCPGNSDDARRDVVLLTNVCEQLCQQQVARQTRLLIFRIPFPPVIIRQMRNAFRRQTTSQQATGHRRVDNDANGVLLTIRQDFLLNI